MTDYVPIPEAVTPSAHGAMNPDQQMLILAQRQEASSRAQLAQALSRMGRFGEAMAVAPGDMKPLIQAYIDAEVAPDDERCGDVRVHDLTDYARNPNTTKIKLETVPNYSRRFRHWSLKYGDFVTHYVCLECGHRNAVPDSVEMHPELTARVQRDEALADKRKEAWEAERARVVEEALAKREAAKGTVEEATESVQES